jgi:hypothetical protein
LTQYWLLAINDTWLVAILLDSSGENRMTDIPNDVVWEVAEIAKIIGRTERQTFHLLAIGELPAKKIGGRWVASKKKLMDALIGEDAA